MTEEELNVILNEANQHYNNKEFELASVKYKKLLEYVPDNGIVCHNLSLSLIGENKFEEAILTLDVPIKQGHYESYLSRGAAYRSLGRYHEAINDFV